MIEKFLPYMIAFVILAVLIATRRKNFKHLLSGITSDKVSAHFPYGKEEALFSPAERSFLSELDRVIGTDYRIFGKIRLADVISVNGGLSNSERQSAFNRIQSKHLDFLICNKDDFSIVGAIELDDKTHDMPGRRERDIFIDAALEAAGVPILRWPLKGKYSTTDLTERLKETFGFGIAGTAGKLECTPRISGSVTADHGYCPTCGAELKKRKINRGQHAGRFILVCTRYPECRFVQSHKNHEKVPEEMNEQVFNMSSEEAIETELPKVKFKF